MKQRQPTSNPPHHPAARDLASVQSWLCEQIAGLVQRRTEEIDIDQPFSTYGLESVDAVGLSASLEDWLQRSYSPTLAYDYPTIGQLARFLVNDLEHAEPAQGAPLQVEGIARDLPIAVIGMGCRFPGGADSPERFWELLRNGYDAVRTIPAERWNDAEYYHPDPDAPGKTYTRHAALLSGVDQFDAEFFGLSPREAKRMDPQHRLLLQVVWESLEHAGLDASSLTGSQTGVFIGYMNTHEYSVLQMQLEDQRDCLDDPYFALGSSSSVAAGRIAYQFDFQGPAVTIDTACSSSLVCAHLACESLRKRECNLALVGGVNALLLPESMINACKMRMLSVDGRCKTFDQAADGFGIGEGCGVLVLKRYEDALADGDHILACIRGSAINQDGRSNGLTAPNRMAQQNVISQALARAGLDPHAVSYIEAHGAGTALGDPIEIEALQNVLTRGRLPGQPLLVGTVKTNIGHTAGAAGVAGLIKTVLSLVNREIPAHLHFEKPNPHIRWQDDSIVIPTTTVAWPESGAPAIAGVSSFGWSGTNAHVILEEVPVTKARTAWVNREDSHASWDTAEARVVLRGERGTSQGMDQDCQSASRGASARPSLLLLSAKTATALDATARNLVQYLEAHPTVELADVAYTYQKGRCGFSERRALCCNSRDDAIQALSTMDAQRVLCGTARREVPKIVFLLPGLGDQYLFMARRLYDNEPVFRDSLTRCAHAFETHLSLDIREIIYPAGAPEALPPQDGSSAQPRLNLRQMLRRQSEPEDDRTRMLQKTAYAQPILFAIEYALAQLWMSWGIRPQALIGYSLGEYTAACLAGVLDFSSAVTLVAQRAQLIESLPRGAMMAVATSESELRPYLPASVSLAITNGPSMCVVAGPVDAIQEMSDELRRRDVVHQRLPTTHAFHSTMMRDIEPAYLELVRSIPLHAPEIPLVSNVTGTWITAQEATDPNYWVKHLSQTVRFADGVRELCAQSSSVMLEVGPGQMLGSLVLQYQASLPRAQHVVLQTLGTQFERRADYDVILRSLGQLWVAGVPIDWNRFNEQQECVRLDLPTYPFETKRHWPSQGSQKKQLKSRPSVPEKLPNIADWFYLARWHEVPLAPRTKPSETASPSTWMVLVGSSPLDESLVERLRELGHRVVVVRAASVYEKSDAHRYSIRADQRADYAQLLREMRQDGLRSRRIVHCWPLQASSSSEIAGLDVQASQTRGFYSLLYLAQALTEGFDDKEDVRLTVLVDRAQSVIGSECIRPEHAPLLGACKVVTQEHPNLQCAVIDIDLADADKARADTLSRLITDEMCRPEQSTGIAYRGIGRWERTYDSLSLLPSETATPALRNRGVYLITGAFGNIGSTLAEWLARTQQARLVLVGRAKLPEREEWQKWLSRAPEQDGLSERIRLVQKLESLGAQVLIYPADVSKPPEVQALLCEIDRTHGVLHGVFHCAGTTARSAFAPLRELTPDACEPHFAPKIRGTIALATALQNRDLDFCLLFSSSSAILGGFGLMAYAAANAFQDAYAHALHRQGLAGPRWISVNWDAWVTDRTGAKGPAAGEAARAYAMDPDEACEAVLRVLRAEVTPHIIQSTADLVLRIQAQTRQLSVAHADRTAAPSPTQIGVEHISDEVERKLAALWCEVLGAERVGRNDNFFERGGNSLVGMQLMGKIRQAFKVDVPAVVLFEMPTISGIARYLRGQSDGGQPVSRAALTRRRQQVQQRHNNEPIAVIGMSCRFPGASSVEQFWDNLSNGVESITFFTEAELLAEGVDPSLLANPSYVKARPILTDVDQFDAAFFGYSPREAALLDPQQRLFLECAWESLESSGYDAERYQGTIGVFGGTNISTYLLTSVISNADIMETLDVYQIGLSNDKDTLTTNVSYKLNLRGPSYNVQTFCSTSLVATHLACGSLQSGECDIALAGAVSLQIPTKTGYIVYEGGIESADGHCRAFDAQAQGTLFGDGVGVVALKRLSDALEDGDVIHAVIKGSAINNDGSLKVSFTAPSIVGQSEVVTEALRSANVNPETVTYVEAHGTGTELGDPIEISALTKAYRLHTERRQYCAIGSVKTNVGHLDRAAGMAGLIKAALALRYAKIPPSLHYVSANPEIDFERTPFFVNTQLTPWESNGHPRRAGVNGLGMGGTNAHLILEEPPGRASLKSRRVAQLLLLSARNPSALERMTKNLQHYLQLHQDTSLADIAYTLQVGRKGFECRRMVVCETHVEASTALSDTPASVVSKQEQRPLAFLFPDSDARLLAFSRELAASEPSYRLQFLRSLEIAKPSLDDRTYQLLLAAHTPQEVDTTVEPPVGESTALVVQYSLAQFLRQCGLHPQGVLGFGVGRYVAACVAGILELTEALSLLGFSRGSSHDESTRELRTLTQSLSLREPTIPYLSSVTGKWLSSEEVHDPAYWAYQTSCEEDQQSSLDQLSESNDFAILRVGFAEPTGTAIEQYLAEQSERDRLVQVSLTDCTDAGKLNSRAILRAIGELWLTGVAINWDDFYQQERRCRVELPTYPFQRQRYWIDAPSSKREPTHQTLEGTLQSLKKEDFSRWFYRPVWKQSVASHAANWAEVASRPWLVFQDDDVVGKELQAALQQSGQTIVSVHKGTSFRRNGPADFTLRPAQAEDYIALFSALRDSEQLPDQIVHLWNASFISPGTTEREAIQGSLQCGFFSVVLIVQNLAKLPIKSCVVSIVTTQGQDVLGEEVLHPVKATAAGPCRVVPLEFENIQCRTIDIASPPWQSKIVMRHLIDELCAPTTDCLIALRGNHRWTPIFEPLPIRDQSPIPIRDNGTYLITGGLGVIGGTVARYFAQHARCNLVLMGRSGLPPRVGWDALCADTTTPERLRRQIDLVRELEGSGARVLVLAANVASEPQMGEVIRETLETFGSLDGVIHAAGVPGTRVIQSKTTQAMQDVLEPKVFGTLVLDRLLRQHTLDFLILFSSIYSAPIGAPAQIDYCAANAFLDAYAHQYGKQHKLTVSLNWGEWQWNEWEYAMDGFDPATRTFLRENRKRVGITFDEGMQAIEQAFSQGLPQVVISPQDFAQLVKLSRAFTLTELMQRAQRSRQGKQRHPRPALATPYVAPNNDQERMVAEVWQEVLGLHKIGIQDSFFELGGNSLVGTELIRRLRVALSNEDIPIHVLYECPNIESMARILQEGSSAVAATVGQVRGERRREHLRMRLAQTQQSSGE